MLTVIGEARRGVAAAAASAFGGIISEVGAAMLVGGIRLVGEATAGALSMIRSAAMLRKDTIS